MAQLTYNPPHIPGNNPLWGMAQAQQMINSGVTGLQDTFKNYAAAKENDIVNQAKLALMGAQTQQDVQGLNLTGLADNPWGGAGTAANILGMQQQRGNEVAELEKQRELQLTDQLTKRASEVYSAPDAMRSLGTGEITKDQFINSLGADVPRHVGEQVYRSQLDNFNAERQLEETLRKNSVNATADDLYNSFSPEELAAIATGSFGRQDLAKRLPSNFKPEDIDKVFNNLSQRANSLIGLSPEEEQGIAQQMQVHNVELDTAAQSAKNALVSKAGIPLGVIQATDITDYTKVAPKMIDELTEKKLLDRQGASKFTKNVHEFAQKHKIPFSEELVRGFLSQGDEMGDAGVMGTRYNPLSDYEYDWGFFSGTSTLENSNFGKKLIEAYSNPDLIINYKKRLAEIDNQVEKDKQVSANTAKINSVLRKYDPNYKPEATAIDATARGRQNLVNMAQQLGTNR